MNEFTPYKHGICGFCGEPTKERFFSGSYETYEECSTKCAGLQTWRKIRSDLTELQCEATDRFELIGLEKELAHTKERVTRLTKKLQRARR